MLLTILATWIFNDWKKQLLLEGVEEANRPYILITRVGLLGLFVFLLLMVRIVWRRRPEATRPETDQ